MAGQEHPVRPLLEHLRDLVGCDCRSDQWRQRYRCHRRRVQQEIGRTRRSNQQRRQAGTHRVQDADIVAAGARQILRLDQPRLDTVCEDEWRRPVGVLGLHEHRRGVVCPDAWREGQTTTARCVNACVAAVETETQSVRTFQRGHREAGKVQRRQENSVVLTPSVLAVEQRVPI